MTRPGDDAVDPASHYDRVTAAWRLLLGENLHYGVFDQGDEPLDVATDALTSLMVDAADLSKGLSVLDVGCGTGAPACELVRRFGVRVVGITTSVVGVDLARGRARELGLDRATFEVRDGMDNGFTDASFDRVWVLESSHLMRRRDRLVAECARVLRPGGRVVLCDIMLRRRLPFEEVRRLLVPLARLRAVFGDARMEALETYAELAGAAGLVVDRADDLTRATRPTFTRWRENAQRHRDAVCGLLGDDGWSDFVASCDVLEGFWDDGTLGYGLLAAVKP
jgi:cyclopropane fatty-acyl-phospholipid synthase-like methyltransferase